MNTKKVIKYWRESAQGDFEVAKSLFKLKHYAPCLFFCHLALEKILKGLVIKQIKTHAPYTHDLVYLAELANLDLDSKQRKNLEEITKFNIKARYDSVKIKFYKTCTKSYTQKYFKISNDFYLWLKKLYPKK